MCAIINPSFPPAEDVPVWVTNMTCAGNEASLDLCQFDGFGVESCPTVGGEVICVQGTRSTNEHVKLLLMENT